MASVSALELALMLMSARAILCGSLRDPDLHMPGCNVHWPT